MKVAFTASGKTLESPLDPRFGRAAAFLVYDLDADSFDVIDNGAGAAAVQGAGTRAAECVVRAGAAALVTGHVGPNAFRALSAAGVSMHLCGAPTVADALALYRAGKLPAAASADVQGHWA